MASALLTQLLDDIKTAMKARERDRLTTLRSLHAQIKDAGTNAGKEETDELLATVIAKSIKQRQQSIDMFREAGRNELAEKETQEIEWIKPYQPEQLDEAAIQAIVTKAISDTGASGKEDMGKLMGAVMPLVKGKADGKLVNQVVMKSL